MAKRTIKKTVTGKEFPHLTPEEISFFDSADILETREFDANKYLNESGKDVGAIIVEESSVDFIQPGFYVITCASLKPRAHSITMVNRGGKACIEKGAKKGLVVVAWLGRSLDFREVSND